MSFKKKNIAGTTPAETGVPAPKRRVHIAAVLAVLLILGLAAANILLGVRPAYHFVTGRTDFSGMTKEIASGYTSDTFVPKNLGITVNGAFARLTGRRYYNDVTLMNNGMLTHGSGSRQDMSDPADKVISLASFLDKQLDIPFLYVCVPYKVPLEVGDLMPAGKFNYKNDNYTDLLDRLRAENVRTLDLRPYYSATQALVEKYMYRTDHHWNSDAAIASFTQVMDSLEAGLGTKLDKTYTDLNLWERHEWTDWWIGSHGKRVGPLFAGTDSLMWYTPTFETEMSYGYIRSNKKVGFFKGDFTSIYLFDKKMARRDWYKVNGNQVYMDKLFPLVVHRNLNAPNPQKVMMIGDSYCRAMQCFLATEFREVYMIDTRYLEDYSVAQYASWVQPDIVMIMTSTVHDEIIIDFGGPQQADWIADHPERGTLLEDYSLSVAASTNKKNAGELPVALEKGQTYHLSFTHVDTGDNTSGCVTAVLYEKHKKKLYWCNLFDVAYGNATGSFEWTIAVPEDDNKKHEYVLLLCPGVWNNAAGKSAEFSGITLEVEQ